MGVFVVDLFNSIICSKIWNITSWCTNLTATTALEVPQQLGGQLGTLLLLQNQNARPVSDQPVQHSNITHAMPTLLSNSASSRTTSRAYIPSCVSRHFSCRYELTIVSQYSRYASSCSKRWRLLSTHSRSADAELDRVSSSALTQRTSSTGLKAAAAGVWSAEQPICQHKCISQAISCGHLPARPGRPAAQRKQWWVSWWRWPRNGLVCTRCPNHLYEFAGQQIEKNIMITRDACYTLSGSRNCLR